MSPEVNMNLFKISPKATIRELIKLIDHNTKGIALVTEKDDRLRSTVTDGDIRRSLLSGVDIDGPVSQLLKLKAKHPPVTATRETPRPARVKLMRDAGVRQLPLLDPDGKLVGLDFLEAPEEDLPGVGAVIMAGGYGKRLLPLTEKLPKPLLPVDGRPMIEHVLDGIRTAGISDVTVTTHYRSGMIEDHLGSGEQMGVNIDYMRESQPQGTAGSLRRLRGRTETLLVVNGDVLTDVDYSSMVRFHRDEKAVATVALRRHEMMVPFGVVDCEGSRIKSIEEKPVLAPFVNAGIYLIEPEALASIPAEGAFDMPDLIQALVESGKPVVGFPIHESWMDVGRPDDYDKANRGEKE